MPGSRWAEQTLGRQKVAVLTSDPTLTSGPLQLPRCLTSTLDRDSNVNI